MTSFFRTQRHNDYYAVLHDEDGGRSTSTAGHSRLYVIATILLTVINISYAVWSPISPPATLKTKKDLHLLRRPSQYIGFDTIHRSSPPIPMQFDNFPIFIGHADTSKPRDPIQDASRLIMSGIGTVAPEERRVLVLPNVSTLAQFRTIDYGMEHCTLRLLLPNMTAPFEAGLRVTKLSLGAPLSVNSPTYSTIRDVPSEILDMQPETIGSDIWAQSFHCAQDSLLSFELSCRTEHCHLEWTQGKEQQETRPALFITQHSTV